MTKINKERVQERNIKHSCYTETSGMGLTPVINCNECDFIKEWVTSGEHREKPEEVYEEENIIPAHEALAHMKVTPKTENYNKQEIKQIVKEAVDKAYTERNILASICARLALRLGYRAGVGIDRDGGNDPEWSHVIYTEVDNIQISHHIAPHDLEVIHGLPVSEGEWDKTFLGKELKTATSVIPSPSGFYPVSCTRKAKKEAMLYAMKELRKEYIQGISMVTSQECIYNKIITNYLGDL